MTIQQLQLVIQELEKGNGWTNTPDEKMTFITEELGEVAKWVRKARNAALSEAERRALNLEIADVVQHVVSLANHFGVDIEAGLLEKKRART